MLMSPSQTVHTLPPQPAVTLMTPADTDPQELEDHALGRCPLQLHLLL